MRIDNMVVKNFIDLNEDEKSIVLFSRNSENIRKWMYNSEVISELSHLEFIEKLKIDKVNKYFLVSQNNEYIGVIYFNKIDYKTKSAYFGLYGIVQSKIKGIGRILEEVSIDYAFNILKLKRLKLEVFSDNIQVRNLHKKYNFIETNKKLINNHEVICMELLNETK